MEVKSFSECWIRIDNMIFEQSLECLVKNDLQVIRNHIEWKQVVVVARVECIEERLAVLSVLSQINHILGRFCSNDTEEELDEQYNKLRQRILNWYDVIKINPEIKNQQ